jgi:hypothetical protein
VPEAHSTGAAGVPLASNGDFRIEDTLSPAPPNPGTSQVLLIENTSGVWFAAAGRRKGGSVSGPDR